MDYSPEVIEALQNADDYDTEFSVWTIHYQTEAGEAQTFEAVIPAGTADPEAAARERAILRVDDLGSLSDIDLIEYKQDLSLEDGAF